VDVDYDDEISYDGLVSCKTKYDDTPGGRLLRKDASRHDEHVHGDASNDPMKNDDCSFLVIESTRVEL